MKKKIFYGYGRYNISGFTMTLVSIALLIYLIVSYCSNPIEPEAIPAFISVIIFLLIFTISIFFATCHYLFQFTVFSEEGIETRTIWRTIRFLKWKDVKEVRLEKYYVAVMRGTAPNKWLIFDDGVERQRSGGLVNKKTYITISATKKARMLVEEFWHGPIIEKE